MVQHALISICKCVISVLLHNIVLTQLILYDRLSKVLRMTCNCMDRVLAARRRRRESSSSSDLRTDDGPRPCQPTNGGSSRSAEEMDRMIDLMMMEEDKIQPRLHRHIKIQEETIKELSE